MLIYRRVREERRVVVPGEGLTPKTGEVPRKDGRLKRCRVRMAARPPPSQRKHIQTPG